MTAACCLLPRAVEPRASVPSVRLARARQLLNDYIARQPAAPRPRRIATGVPSLDEALGGGLPLGALCQVDSTAGGVGTLSLALRLACAAAGPSRFIFLIDPTGYFYPPAALQCGMDLQRLVIVRDAHPAQAVWAKEQALRCNAAGAVIGLLPRLDDRALRRLQLAAEAGGGVGFLVHEARPAAIVPFAAARLTVEPLTATDFHPKYELDIDSQNRGSQPPVDAPRFVRVHLALRRRAATTSIALDLHHATSPVPLHAAAGDRPGRPRLRAIG
jgi:hypothetical protein